MDRFLTEGEVFEIKEGMRCYAELPKKFVYQNCSMSDEMTKTDFTVGQIRQNRVDLDEAKHKIITGIKERFSWALSLEVDEKTIEDFVTPLLSSYKEEKMDTSVFKGEYVVTKAFDEGIAYKVFARQLKDGKFAPDSKEISFYQSGHYNVTILPQDIEVLRTLQMSFA